MSARVARTISIIPLPWKISYAAPETNEVYLQIEVQVAISIFTAWEVVCLVSN